jgi:phosphoenolpyruvate-protein phosphotransferase
MKKGVPVSPGVAVARAFVLGEVAAKHEARTLEAGALSAEVSRLDVAIAAASQELDGIIARVSRQVGENEASIFRAHRLLLRDPAFIGKVKSTILLKKVDAQAALRDALDEYSAIFAEIHDEYLRERMTDLRDVIGRIDSHLSLQKPAPQLAGNEPVIIVAAEILPSQALAFDRLPVAGIVTEAGGSTGHAAILARALGIPAVSGLRGIISEIHTGETVAIDGREGHVYLSPGPELEAAYRKLQREYGDMRARLIENRELASISADGTTIELLANVNNPADALLATQAGATGVGLYRTEYLFLSHPSVPDEDEQLKAYRAVIEASPNRTVTIRTLDLGGDKQVPYLGDPHEANPFMGWRSTRISTTHPEFFQTQLRAILRAGEFGRVSLLFPMVSTLEEVVRLKRMVARSKLALQRRGLPHADKIPLGVMLEVPAAALCVEALIQEVDFVSIGSNDLIQYVMAADRDNPKVAHLCEPFSPAIMRLLDHIIRTCNVHGTPLTLCGEMAGRPRCFLPLFGMGLRRLSMSPAFVPALKEFIRRTDLSQAEQIAARVLTLKTFSEIRAFLTRQARAIWPEVTMWDTTN